MTHATFFRTLVGLAVETALSALLAFGQQPSPAPEPPAPSPAPPSGGSTGAPGGRTPSPSIPTIPTQPTTPTDRTRQPDFGTPRERTPSLEPRPIFLSGKVMMDDGTPPPDSVVIERVCNGVARPEAYTDSKGRFSFQIGQNMNVMADASVSSAADPLGGFGSQQQQRGAFGQSRGLSERDLMSCELRASLPGYRSDMVNLAGRRMMDNPDVGVIILRRMGNVQGTTISATTMQAPKDAKKAFEKGADALRKKKFEEAQKQFEKAVELYPKYAVAWFELGLLHQQRKQGEPAKKAYAEALAADAKFVKPYLQLALLSVQEQKWQEVADTTGRVLKLNPFDFPSAYFYNSVANFNLRNFDAAEKSAREALKLDSQHRIPKIEHLLGIILANKQDYTGAAEHMKSYLQQAPEASDIELVKKQLADIERLLGARSVAQPPAPPPE